MKIRTVLEVLSLVLIGHFAMEARAADGDQCTDPPVWVVALDAIIPAIGIITSLSYFCVIRCCTKKSKKIIQRVLRFISIGNWFIFWVSVVLLILSCEKVTIEVGGVKVTQNIYIAVMVVAWIFMMFESYICRERWYIKHLGTESSVVERIEEFRNAQPEIVWKVVGYNIETQNLPVCSKVLPCSTPVVKFHDSKDYVYNHWVDHSSQKIKGGHKAVITRVKLKEDIKPGNVETKRDVEDKKQQWKDGFKDRNERFVDFLEEASIPDFEKRLAIDESVNCCLTMRECCSQWKGCQCCHNCDGCVNCCSCLRECCTPIFIGQAPFWIASALALTWPYRWLFKCLTAKTRYTIGKNYYISQPQLQNYTVREYGEIVKDTGHVKMQWEESKWRKQEASVSSAKKKTPASGGNVERASEANENSSNASTNDVSLSVSQANAAGERDSSL